MEVSIFIEKLGIQIPEHASVSPHRRMLGGFTQFGSIFPMQTSTLLRRQKSSEPMALVLSLITKSEIHAGSDRTFYRGKYLQPMAGGKRR